MGSNEVILLDTHVLIWTTEDDRKIGARSKAMIADALANSQVAISAFTFWEIALLAARRRVRAIDSPEDLRNQFLSSGGIELPVTGKIGILSVALENLHGDPADRLIVATALSHEATLLTADSRLLSWGGQLRRHDATT